jgi:hypothetical protein
MLQVQWRREERNRVREEERECVCVCVREREKKNVCEWVCVCYRMFIQLERECVKECLCT